MTVDYFVTGVNFQNSTSLEIKWDKLINDDDTDQDVAAFWVPQNSHPIC